MSMISAQIDELRKWADQLSERENEFGVVVRALVAALRDAADTICELRGALQVASVDYRHLAAENAKLRELCVKALEWLRWAGGITCPPEVPDEFADELRELGVEVD